MSRLIAFGSSPIIYTHSADAKLKNLTYPAIIAQKLGKEYVAVARLWTANNKITRKVLSFDFAPNDFALITWSTTARVEFRSEHGWFVANRDDFKPNTFEEAWYQGPGKWEYTSILSVLKEMLLTQSFLKSKGIPYLFLFDNSEYFQSYLTAFPDQHMASMNTMLDHTRILSFENNTGFLDWCQKNNYPFAPPESRGYPIQTAHQRAAEYILEKFQF